MPPASAGSDGFQLEAHLVHAEPGRRVVEASAWRGGSCLGRCLGEAADAEAAEDRALERLHQRLGNRAPAAAGTTAQAMRPPAAAPVRIRPAEASAPVADPPREQESLFTGHPDAGNPQPHQVALDVAVDAAVDVAVEAPRDPEDWSDELAALEIQLARLQWDRNQESVYLERAFGHPSRSRITTYADLLAYVRALRDLPNGSGPESAPVPLRRRDLISQSDQLLASLRWDAARGRQLLEDTFQLASRQQLSDAQLLQFNMLLEEQLITAGRAHAAAAGPG